MQERLLLSAGLTEPEYKVSSAPDRDDWDTWNSDRDHIVRNSESVGHTNRYYTGVNDLDNNGRWVYVPGYGNVWQPYQEATWAPYQTGRWVWEPYYGWTWVSYEPWGWAPYHYGRWFYYGKILVLVAWTALCRLSSAMVSGIRLLCRLRTPRRLRLWLHRMVPGGPA